jgi:CBS domain-containing protein/uncharacterized membrane protein
MTPEVAVATESMTVAETIEYLRQFAKDASDLHYVYLVADADEDGRPVPGSKLVGVVTLYELLIQGDDVPLSEFAHRKVMSVEADADQEDVAEMIAKYNLLALPVVDEDGNLLGTVTVDDALDVMEAEAEEDLARAIGRSEGAAASAAADAVGGEGGFMLVLRKIGRGLRWLLPQSTSWVAIWLSVMLITFIGITHIASYMEKAYGATNPNVGMLKFLFALYTTLVVLQILFAVLPLMLTTIRYAILRAIECLTDRMAFERPNTGMLYLTGAGIALGQTILVYVVTTFITSLSAMPDVQPSFTEFFGEWWTAMSGENLMLILLPLSVALLLVSVLAVWLVTRAVAADDADVKIKPSSYAAIVMLAFVLALTVSAFTTISLYFKDAINEQVSMIAEYSEEDFGYMDGYEDYGDEGAEYYDEGDFGDFEMGDGEMLTPEELEAMGIDISGGDGEAIEVTP